MGALAVAALPVLVAVAASYQQQLELERSLASIHAVVQRIEERLEDIDVGTCDAAEGFMAVMADATTEGGMTDYLAAELAVQRVAIEALYSARKRWVERFKTDLERQQGEREKSKGSGQPWVDAVTERVTAGRLEKEVIIFVRSLLLRTKLSVIAAAALAEEQRGATALRLISRAENELRKEFFDLHRRLTPLARIPPELSRLQRLPGMSRDLQRAHQTVKILVEHLDQTVLPGIPDPGNARDSSIYLSSGVVAELAAAPSDS